MKIFLSVILGLLAAMFAAVLVAALTSGPKGMPALSLGPTDAQVVVATKELPAGHVLAESDLKLDVAQLGDLGAGAITSVRPAIGRVLVRPVIVGQQVTSRMIAGVGTGPEIAAMLKQGNRAATITIADRGLAAFVYPGATVDVISIFDVPRGYEDAGKPVSRTVLQGVSVLAVEGYSDALSQFKASQDPDSSSLQSRNSKGPTITLLLTPREAQILQLAKSLGSLSVTLRPSEEVSGAPAEAATLEQLLQLTAERDRDRDRDLPQAPTTVVVMQPDDAGPASEPAPVTTVTAKPAAPARESEDWKTTIIRGGKRTTYSFKEADDEQD